MLHGPRKMKHMTRSFRLTPKSNVQLHIRRARFHSSVIAPVHLLHPRRTFPNVVRRASRNAGLGTGLRRTLPPVPVLYG